MTPDKTETTPTVDLFRNELVNLLEYLKQIHNLSDQQVVKRWVENPYWQYLCGEVYFCHEMPIDPSSL